jgi:hypothetical protein
MRKAQHVSFRVSIVSPLFRRLAHLLCCLFHFLVPLILTLLLSGLCTPSLIGQARLGKTFVARERLAPYRKDVLTKSGKTVGGSHAHTFYLFHMLLVCAVNVSAT